MKKDSRGPCIVCAARAHAQELLCPACAMQATDSRNETPAPNLVDHPEHYTHHPSGVECITVAEHFNFNIGNAIKYLWRSEHKGGEVDLAKARWYIERELKRRSP